MPCVLKVQLPSDMLEVWRELEPGGSHGFKKESNNQEIDVVISKHADDTLLVITGDSESYISITQDSYFCKITNSQKQSTLSAQKKGLMKPRNTSGKRQKSSVAVDMSPHPDSPPIRRSSRTKTLVIKQDFVVPPLKKSKLNSRTNVKDGLHIQSAEGIVVGKPSRNLDKAKTSSAAIKKNADVVESNRSRKIGSPSVECSGLRFSRINQSKKNLDVVSHEAEVSTPGDEGPSGMENEFHTIGDMTVISPVVVKSEPGTASQINRQCSMCDTSCDTKEDMQRHMLSFHKLEVSSCDDTRVKGDNPPATADSDSVFRKEKCSRKRKIVPRNIVKKENEKDGKEPAKKGRPRKNNSSYREIVVNDKNSPLVQTVKPPRIKPPPDRYVISDTDLAGLPENHEGCLLCGKSWPAGSGCALRNHIYIVHKVLQSDQAEVLKETGAASRRQALDKLEAYSKKQMIASGKHCPLCFVGCIKGRYLLNHIQCHADHPDYQSLIEQVQKQMQLNDMISSQVSNSKKVKKKTAEDDTEAHTERPSCPVCAKTFESRDGIRRHIKHMHGIRWSDFTAMMQLPEEQKRQKFEALCNKQMPEHDSEWSKKYLDAERQVIACVRCSEFIPCKDYRPHLVKEHPDLEDVDQIIGEMEEVIMESTYRAVHCFNVECPICKMACAGNVVVKHVQNSHRNHEDYETHLSEITRHVRQLTNVKRNGARDRRSALKIKHCCRFCNTRFQDLSSISNHENYRCKMNKDVKPSFFCKYCGQRGTTEKWFAAHLKKHNQNGSNYICYICGRGYTSKSGLHMHLARQHKKLTKFTCEVCGKKFYVSSHYKSHMLKHTADRNHQCDICGKAFKSRGCVRRHKRTVHLKKYTYHCEKCGHGVDKLDSLKTHRCENVRLQIPDPLLTSDSVGDHVKDTPGESLRTDLVSLLKPTATNKYESKSLLKDSAKRVSSITLNKVEESTVVHTTINMSHPHRTVPSASMELVSGSALPKVYMKPVDTPKIKVTQQGHVGIVNNPSTALLRESSFTEKPKQIGQHVIFQQPQNIGKMLTAENQPLQTNVQPVDLTTTCTSEVLDQPLELVKNPKTANPVADIILATEGVGISQDQQESFIQEVFVDHQGQVLSAGPSMLEEHSIDGRDGDLQSIVLVKSDVEDDSLNNVLELPSLIWMTTDSEHT